MRRVQPGMPRRARIVSVACCTCALLFAAVACAAGEHGALTGATSAQGPDLGFPSAGRVVFGFLVTAGLAVGAAWVLRRWWPAFARPRTSTTSIRTVDRSAVSASLNVYVLEVDGARYLVAEGRSGVALTRTSSVADTPTVSPR